MRKIIFISHTRRRSTLLAAGLLTVGLAATAIPSPVAAADTLSVTVANEFGIDKVISKLEITDSVAFISRLPEVKATIDEAIAKNTTAPELSCTSAAGSVKSSSGAYASLDGVLVLTFSFAANVPSTTNSCTLSKTTYLKDSGDTVYPLSAAGRTALWGDPTTVREATEARLSSLKPGLKKAMTGAWKKNYTKVFAKALPSYTWKSVDSKIDVTSTSTKDMYIVRNDGSTTGWVNICQRLADGRTVCMKYSPLKKSTFRVLNDPTNYFTTELTTEGAAS